MVGAPCPGELAVAVIVYAADHGVAARGVSAYPSRVTAQMVTTMAADHAAVNVLARTLDAEMRIVDVGVATDVSMLGGIVHAKVRRGTADFVTGPAMTSDEARRALDVGRREAARALDSGADALFARDIGIGNTTTSASLLRALLNEEPARVVGRGTGVEYAGLQRRSIPCRGRCSGCVALMLSDRCGR